MRAGKTLLSAVVGLRVGGLVLVVAAIAAAFHLATSEKAYESKAVVFLTTVDAVPDQYVETPALGARQLRACAEVTRSTVVVHDVIATLGLTTTPRAVQRDMTAEVVAETSLLRLTARGSSADAAHRLGAAWADSSARLLGGPAGRCSTEGQPVLATVTDPATYAPDAVSPDVSRTLLVAGLAGLAAAVALGLAAALVTRRLTRSRNPQAAQPPGGQPV